MNLLKSFKFSPFVTICGTILCFLMIKASFWQWDRYKNKVELIKTYQANSNITAENFPLPTTDEEYDFKHLLNKRIKLKGTFDYSRQLIITNRKSASGPGHILLTPLQLSGTDHWVIISRGFIPFADRTPSDWLKYDFEKENVQFEGILKASISGSAIGPQNPKPTSENPFPTIWFYEEIPKIAQLLPYKVITGVFVQKLGAPSVGSFPAEAVSIEVPPSTHFGYTIEWAILSVLTLLATFFIQAYPWRKGKKVIYQYSNSN